MLDQLTVEDFAPHVGRRFALGDQHAMLELVSASALRRVAAGTRAGFALVFSGDVRAHLKQGVHAVEHPSLGTLDLFIVPIGPAGEAMQYEAIFN